MESHILQAKTHYDVLRINKDILAQQPDALRAAYRALCKHVHPDKSKHPKATEAFQKLQLAFDVLKDGARRAAYDASLRAAPSPIGRSGRTPYRPPQQRAPPASGPRSAPARATPPPPPRAEGPNARALSDSLRRRSLPVLREVCRRFGQPSAGSKEELSARLISRVERHEGSGVSVLERFLVQAEEAVFVGCELSCAQESPLWHNLAGLRSLLERAERAGMFATFNPVVHEAHERVALLERLEEATGGMPERRERERQRRRESGGSGTPRETPGSSKRSQAFTSSSSKTPTFSAARTPTFGAARTPTFNAASSMMHPPSWRTPKASREAMPAAAPSSAARADAGEGGAGASPRARQPPGSGRAAPEAKEDASPQLSRTAHYPKTPARAECTEAVPECDAQPRQPPAPTVDSPAPAPRTSEAMSSGRGGERGAGAGAGPIPECASKQVAAAPAVKSAKGRKRRRKVAATPPAMPPASDGVVDDEPADQPAPGIPPQPKAQKKRQRGLGVALGNYKQVSLRSFFASSMSTA